jgi:putative SOS response-associated peptidase YedK
MCASYGLEISVADLHYGFSAFDERESDAALERWLEEFRDQPVKPTGVHARNLNPVVRERERDGERIRTIDLAWWKLWVRGEPAKFPAINARAESILGSGAWSGPFARRRVLVPATEYHEKGHRFTLDEGLFAFAGISAVSKTTDGEWMVSYAIMTRPAASHIVEIHDRMPLIVAPDLYDEWLDPTHVGDAELLDEALAASGPMADRLRVAPLG